MREGCVEDAVEQVTGRRAVALLDDPLQPFLLEVHLTRSSSVDDPVGEQHEDGPGIEQHVSSPEGDVGQGADDRAARPELEDPIPPKQQWRLVAGVDVGEVAVRLELAVEDGNVAARRVAAVDDSIELREHVFHPEVLLEAHPQPSHDVADHQRRGKPVAAGVADGKAHQVLGHVDEVAEVPADLLHREGTVGDVETG